MVSELWYGSYAVALTGSSESSQGVHPASPINQNVTQGPSEANQQRSYVPQRNMDDLENPLYLNVNENPNAVLVSPPLSGSANYASWQISMQVAIEVKNKWGLIDGTLAPPKRSHPQYAAWRRCNLIVCSWILKSVISSIAQSVMHMDRAKDIWNDLKRCFSQHDAHRISFLQNDISNLKQGHMSVNDYYTKCRTLWEEMNALRPLPICKCDPRCSCDLLDEIRRDREIDQIIRFLQGLIEDYNTLKSGVLLLDPLPDMHKVFVMFEKFERQLTIKNMSMTNPEMMQVNATQNEQNTREEMYAAMNFSNGKRMMNSQGGNKNNAKCTFCGMTGHTIEKCYKKHGYPPGWVPGFKSRNKQQVAAVGTNSKNNSNSEQIRSLISLLQSMMMQNQPTSTAAATLVPRFSPEAPGNEGKYIKHLNVNSVALSSYAWIIDSGATDHIVCSLGFFDKYHSVNGAKVNLPNESYVAVELAV
ncbi:PREDICTED: uncharacterized protein LOC109159942 [Ipomoea nil]|uniref:uncharacterized protein LOC109159942 n=1 Tax=Ipomoea nil TaxID=35883 RepID=UPI0009012E76|nr:PREDICTED: uncharacterized protein LOC109159942 [Ipomoea nil]